MSRATRASFATPHPEKHFINRVGWLRAAVLGANDGIVSTASLIMGVAAAGSTRQEIALAGLAGLVAGAMSMAAGEYISVSSQADSERADLDRERQELAADPDGEHEELVDIYMSQGMDRNLADQVATELMKRDALAVHAREELGITEMTMANPIQAGLASAATFTMGAALPLLSVLITPMSWILPCTLVVCLITLGILGGVSAKVGGANIIKAVIRVVFWSSLAMLVTAGVGHLFGHTAI